VDTPAVQVESLIKNYGPSVAVDRISFDVKAGEILGLLGPNGAGKTTLISMLATRIRPTAGDAEILGHSIVREPYRVRRVVGVVPQDVSLYPKLTGAENLRFFGRVAGDSGRRLEERVDALIHLVGLEHRRDDLVSAYSGGMKRRLNLAVGLVHHPGVVLLDEPTVGVDPQSREHIFGVVLSLKESGAAVVYTTHYMEEAERLCDRIAIVDGGRIVALGTLDQLLQGSPGPDVIEIRGLERGADLAPLERALATYGGGVKIEIAPVRLDRYFLQLTGKTLRD
jgi:ABC-2 type transport system ATP-binding protein